MLQSLTWINTDVSFSRHPKDRCNALCLNSCRLYLFCWFHLKVFSHLHLASKWDFMLEMSAFKNATDTVINFQGERFSCWKASLRSGVSKVQPWGHLLLGWILCLCSNLKVSFTDKPYSSFWNVIDHSELQMHAAVLQLHYLHQPQKRNRWQNKT